MTPFQRLLLASVLITAMFTVACSSDSKSSGTDTASDTPADTAGDTPVDTPADTPADTVGDSTNDVGDAPGDTLADVPNDTTDVTDTTDTADTMDTMDTADMGGCTAGTPLPAQCLTSSPPMQATLCFENASACPGDTVDIDIYINAAPNCATLVQATGTFDSTGFELANPAAQNTPTMGQCIRRENCTICNPNVFDWAILPGNAVGVMACPDDYPIPAQGTPIDTVQVTIPMGTTPGDYLLDMGANANLIAVESVCGGTNIGGFYESTEMVAPTIRVY